MILAISVAISIAINSITGGDTSVWGALDAVGNFLAVTLPSMSGYLLVLPFLFLINFVILFGPMLALGLQQIKAYEPGDADWGVKLADVRGQAEAKEEVTRVVSLWQSGEEFVKAGGKRERGVLFLGAPGTGKTMLSKAIATSFNCPFVTIPGSGFAQTFIGMDAVLVRWLAWKARRLSQKWGGQCIVFIDEIDAVGMRRRRSAAPTAAARACTTSCSSARWARSRWRATSCWRTGSGATACSRAAPSRRARSTRRFYERIRNIIPGGMMGGGQGGGLALNQLLVVMDGIDEPPAMRKWMTRKVNTFLDALYIVPQRIGKLPLRRKPPQPRPEQIYFIGACNVDLEVLDPALTRPGRLGRHIYFRTPTWEDRRDIFDLYLGKVDHADDLDGPGKRDELARITNGYSPAMIDQVCSLALTYAHAQGRERFSPDGHPRRDDDGRVRRRHRPAVPQARGARDRDPRGRPRGLRPPVHGEPPVDAAVDPQARLLRRPPRRDGGRGPQRALALGGGRRPDLGPRRDGRRVRLLRPEHDRRDRRRARRHVARGADGRLPGDGPGPDRAG